MIQTSNTLLINVLISSWFVQWSTHNVNNYFHSLDLFCTQFNDIEPFGCFISIAMRGLLLYGNTMSESALTRLEVNGGNVIRGGRASTIRRMKSLVVENKHGRLPFFNDPDGVRISVRINTHQTEQRRPARRCAHCRSWKTGR